MNKQRFLVAVAITVVLFAVAGIMWVFLSAPPVPEQCTPTRELELVTGFKGDAIVLGIFGALFAACLYYFMLRYQVFFPGPDAKRFVTAVGSGVAFALLSTIIALLFGPQCLQKALGPGSAIEDLSLIRSLAGDFVGNVWLAMILDQMFLALAFTGVARLWRQFL